ncbi:MAG: hypothetical protein HRT63_01600 [Erythrobacter sp.]|nr:hypothetical protein [Erythrobacter sp.]
MSGAKSNPILKSKWLNGWPLFFAISVPMSLLIAYVTWQTDTASPEGISFLIGHWVRWAVPFMFIVIAASSVQIEPFEQLAIADCHRTGDRMARIGEAIGLAPEPIVGPAKAANHFV